jgi:hypothetical protein
MEPNNKYIAIFELKKNMKYFICIFLDFANRKPGYGFGFKESLLRIPGSGMFIPDPDFYPSRISDPGSKNSIKREG